MKNRIIFILCLVIITIIFLFPVVRYSSDNLTMEDKIKDNVNYIIENIDNDGLYIIERGIIKNNDRVIETDKKELGNGKFYKYQNGKIVGYLNYSGNCGEITLYDKSIKINKKTCDYEIVPEKLSTFVKDSQKELKTVSTNNSEEFDILKYYYGENPDNYIIFMDRCWRIIGFTTSGTAKLIYEGKTNKNTCNEVATDMSGSLGLYTWDMDKKRIGNWETSSSLLDIFNDWVYYKEINNGSEKIALDLDKIKDAYWNIGMVSSLENYEQIINDEQSEKTKQKYKIGLINLSDYYRVAHNEKNNSFDNNNYLYKSKYNWWTINYSSENEKKAWTIMKNGNIESKLIPLSNEYFFSGTRISIFLNDVKVAGIGSAIQPFVVVE